jgi:hypothetical protein
VEVVPCLSPRHPPYPQPQPAVNDFELHCLLELMLIRLQPFFIIRRKFQFPSVDELREVFTRLFSTAIVLQNFSSSLHCSFIC